MNFLEFVGFVAMLLLALNSMRERKRRKENPEEVESEEEENAKRLREFLQGVNSDMQEMKTPAEQKTAPPRVPQKKPVITYKKEFLNPTEMQTKGHSISHQGLQKDPFQATEKDPYASSSKDAYAFVHRRKSRAQALMSHLKSRKDMVILREIIGPPKG